VAPPGISADQKKALTDAMDRMAKSKEWQDLLKQKGWEDAYMSGDAFAKNLADEQNRTKEVLTAVGLVKS
jgi:putative tricarboxylic transport membrane protein